ncbi:MAG: photosynthetic reaction center cytochrome c subunit [Acidobacteria bacterium]|nr:photosynthetic reaction center cytochrome c subunit [Acidobacteriota bacterium]
MTIRSLVLFAALVLLVSSCRTPSDPPAPDPGPTPASGEASARADQMEITPVPPPEPNPQTAPSPPPAPPNPIIARLREEIAGKEHLPAEQVFENIQIMEGIPAGRLLSIMERGFAPALGVRCSFCHEPGNWSSDEKEQKRTAREMWKMAADINTRIEGITGEKAMVNCSTCHQGNSSPPGHGARRPER